MLTSKVRPVLTTKVPCGAGRWGGRLERHAVASRMREGKAAKRARTIQAALTALHKRVVDVISLPSLGRRMALTTMQAMVFSVGRRTADLAAQYSYSRSWIRQCLAACAGFYLQAQLMMHNWWPIVAQSFWLKTLWLKWMR